MKFAWKDECIICTNVHSYINVWIMRMYKNRNNIISGYISNFAKCRYWPNWPLCCLLELYLTVTWRGSNKNEDIFVPSILKAFPCMPYLKGKVIFFCFPFPFFCPPYHYFWSLCLFFLIYPFISSFFPSFFAFPSVDYFIFNISNLELCLEIKSLGCNIKELNYKCHCFGSGSTRVGIIWPEPGNKKNCDKLT